MSDLKCDRCGGTKFYEGPSGGASINIICANPKCRARYNHTPLLDRMEFTGFEPSEDERRAEKLRVDLHKWGRKQHYYRKGIDTLLGGGTATDVIMEQIDYDVDSNANIYCELSMLRDFMLAGYMDALRYRMGTRHEDEEVKKSLCSRLEEKQQQALGKIASGPEAGQQSDGATGDKRD